ncbi:MAG TPA: hypothetical protein VEV17_11540 [Bryobacteraceae bacterium]|nr:hypothetical protein [Bryobacteraceae bacterium]
MDAAAALLCWKIIDHASLPTVNLIHYDPEAAVLLRQPDYRGCGRCVWVSRRLGRVGAAG